MLNSEPVVAGAVHAPRSIFKRCICIVALIAAAAASAPAAAGPVKYSFSGNSALFGTAPALISALNGLTLSGSFSYDSSGALVGIGGAGPNVLAGAASYAGVTNLTGSLGSNSFADSSGAATVMNELYAPPLAGAPFDLLQLGMDPVFGAAGNYTFSGFSSSGFTLANLRIFWSDAFAGSPPDFLSDSSLPAVLPTFSARVAFDFLPSSFVRPADGSASPPVSAYSILFMDGVTVSATAVAEPGSLALTLVGLLALAAVGWRRRRV